MKETDSIDPFAVMQRAFPASSAINAAARQNASNFWEAQEKFLECMEGFAAGWFERRHAGTRAALASAREMCSADTPFDAMREYQKWAIGSFERVMQDGLACQKQLIEMSRVSAQPVAQAAENVRDAASEAMPRGQSRTRAA